MANVSRKTKLLGVLSAGGVLDRIVEAKARRLEEAKLRVPVEGLASRALAMTTISTSRPLSAALCRPDRINVIAEIKQRSPSKGIIRADFNPARIAESYARGGAAALSVLAEEDFFGGALEHLEAARCAGLPLLRKDFIFDEYQIFESIVAGADAVLLIVAVLDDELLARLIRVAGELGLEALVEVHSAGEMKRAVQAGAAIIGINNRDLTTFKVDLNTSIELAALAPEGAVLVSESGINNGGDIRRLRSAGFSAFLIGEHLMRADDPGAALVRLMEDARD